MAEDSLRLLLVEDSPGDVRLLQETLRSAGARAWEMVCVSQLSEVPPALEEHGVDLILLDLSLPDAAGLDSVRQAIRTAPHLPIIVLTGLDDSRTAVDAVKAGAQDYLIKGQVEGELLVRSIRYAMERKRLEQERVEALAKETQARASMQEALKARDEVLRVVSHDLRNPLSTIGITVELLLDGTIPPAQVEKHLNVIRRSVDRMDHLIEDLLDVARIESGRLSLNMEYQNLAAIAREAVELNQSQAVARGIMLECEGPKRPAPVVADSARIFQVLSNLIGNALKFSVEGDRVRVLVESGEEEVCCSVTDSGPGIAAEDLEHIFRPFWQARYGPGGAGLGLTISRGIIEAHGGTISVASTVGSGTTFTFSLPTAPDRRTPRE